MSKQPLRTEDIFDASDTRPKDASKRTKNQEIENWLNNAYDFRFNVLKQKPEWKQKTQTEFIPLDKYHLLSIKRELDAVGFTISKDGLMDILGSSFSGAVNPVKDYFKKLPKWDQDEDYIKELSKTLTVKNDSKLYEYLKKWLVGVVSNVYIDERCTNHLMLVLTGAQGAGKTTWLESLCPKKLKPYLFSGKLNLESKDTLTLIAENLFVNIDDQLKQLHKKDENELKNLITINQVKYRRPYDPFIVEYPHLCSFMGSVNGNEFLNDPTGSRRFLPFEVLAINKEATNKIDMDKVWSQAVYLFENKFKYWIEDKEILELHENNSGFSMISAEEDLLTHYFSIKALEGSYNPIKFLTPSVILSYLERKSNLRLGSKKLGEALNKLGYKKEQKMIDGKYTWGYHIYEKTNEEIERQTNVTTIQKEIENQLF